MDRMTADIICRALLAIVSAIRKEYKLPEYHNITISLNDSIAGLAGCDTMPETK